MKKVLLGIFLVAAIAVVSCKKEKDCKCTVTMDGEVIGTSTETTEEKCSEFESETNVMGIVTKTTCVEE